MPDCASDPARLLLVGDADSALGVAKEMAGTSGASLAVCSTSSEALERLWRMRGDLVMIDVPVDVPDILARLRGDRAAPTEGLPSIDRLVGRTVAEVERALILQTLAHCRGNRTSASTILGISVRTMRNKLRTFIEDGIQVAPAN